MSYTSKDIKNIVAEILENKKDKGGVKSLYFVGCGGSLGALYPAKTFMEKECSNIKSALINSNEFVHSTPKDFGENSIICLSCHKGNTPETIAAAKLGKEKGAAVIILTWLEESEIVEFGDYIIQYSFDASPDHLKGDIDYAGEKTMCALLVAVETLQQTAGYENYDKLPDLQKQVYKVIVKRFLAIFYPPAEYNKIQVTVNVENETFYASGKVCINQGYLEILKPVENKKSTDSDEKEENSQNTNLDILKNLKKGQKVNCINYETKEAETSPPSRYNSGSIILAMENAGKLIEEEELREQIKGAGIGTSATRAEIMKKLEKIKYIQINSKTQIITPTEKGEIIYDIVNNSMPDMLNPKLTASWEKGLDMVAKKEIQPNEFMNKLTNYIHSKFNKLVVKW